MQNQPYVTITHYKEREFYFLNYAIQTEDGFIPKEIEQFHESEKEKFIERIRQLQKKYPKNQVISLSLTFNQVVKDKEDPNKACAKIFKENYVVQDKIDIGNVPVTLYFSPFALIYEEYKNKLDEKLTLLIGLFDRKLYIMFATADKIQQSWIIGTRGLSEKQVADRVYKSMKAYYKISYKFADQVEMLVNDDSPKLLKVLREELSMSILPTQKTIHYLLHHMGSEQSHFMSSFIKSYLSVTQPQDIPSVEQEEIPLHSNEDIEDIALNSLDDIRLNNPSDTINTTEQSKTSFLSKAKSTFSSNSVRILDKKVPVSLFSFIPLLFVLASGGYFAMQNSGLEKKINLIASQSLAQSNSTLFSMTSKDVFGAMGKNAELQSATISTDNIELKGVVWGIEPLRNSLDERFPNGEFIIKPLENFMTEFSFKSKV